MPEANKFAELFSDDMSADEARYVLYSHCDGLSDADLKELFGAYYPVSDAILERELASVKI